MMKTIKNLSALLLTALLLAFTVELRAQEDDSDDDDTQTTGISKYGHGQDSINCVTNLSLYGDYYKQWRGVKKKEDPKRYNDLGNTAYKYWRYCFLNCPMASQNVYSRGVRLVDFKINGEKDSIKQQAYVDTLMMVYNNRIKYFPNNPKYPVGYLMGRQAVDLFQNRKSASQEYFPIFKESVKLMQDSSEPTVLYGYFIAAIQYWKDGHSEIDQVYEIYMQINDLLQMNINAKGEEKAKRYVKVANKLEPIMLKIATCEKLVSVFEPKFDANPTDTILARNLVRLFELRKCTKEDLYYKALKQVHKIAPNSQSAYSMGRMSVERELYNEAEQYLIQAVELLPDSMPDRAADTYMLLADVYNKSGKLSKSRDAARNALKYRPDFAFAYLLIGELYVKSAKSCSWKDLPVAYWAAADKFSKAAAVATDEKIKEIAYKQLASVKASFPAQQDVFMRNLSDGQSFTVECWIQENTTVRVRK